MEGFMRKALGLLHEIYKPSTCREMWANFMHDKLWVWQTSSKPKFVAQSRFALYISTICNKLIMQGKQLETPAKLRIFVSNGFVLKATIYEVRIGFGFSYFAAFRTQGNIFILFCSEEEEVYTIRMYCLNKTIKNPRGPSWKILNQSVIKVLLNLHSRLYFILGPFVDPAVFWPRGQNPRRHPRSPRVFTYKDKEYLLKSKKCVCDVRRILDLTNLGAHGGLG